MMPIELGLGRIHLAARSGFQIPQILVPRFSAKPLTRKPNLLSGNVKRLAGRLAQLVRAPSSHGGSHRFESCAAHSAGRSIGRQGRECQRLVAPLRAAVYGGGFVELSSASRSSLWTTVLTRGGDSHEVPRDLETRRGLDFR